MTPRNMRMVRHVDGFHRNGMKMSSICTASSSKSQTSIPNSSVWKRFSSSTSGSSAVAAASKKEGTEVSDMFFDNLGTMFLSAIAITIAALVRSSYSSSNRIAARDALEEETELDPLEIHELQLANGPELNKEVMGDILNYFVTQNGEITAQKMTYTSFVSQVLHVMRKKYDERFTIQLGHLLDRLALKNVQQQRQLTNDDNNNNSGNGNGEDDDLLDLDLLLTILSVALHGSITDRVDVLFQIMMSQQTTQSDVKDYAPESHLLRMITNLQKTCQLVPDAQILETEGRKYPLQQYHVGTPHEMLTIAKESQKEKISQQASEQQQWDCHDFHVLLRSKAICAWGECYHKTNLKRITKESSNPNETFVE
eukprot:CAMPEP_0197830404 /NCGR_PEP_ID=MMETSP1437-20131217/7013_1 /TAXON_ID=49252 ORGANISM="Eucampia antarctica, Strain CCMP1452" /NCGR_SAMPLE_ID=MMETSP1437 /ASSEMBLY_ACC=CAM_ASM_001096 /LENGTH=367 /DNA_ID=CAMNT_0043432795 /DNA_START=171 /DNA_END=1274 /DNA_ORIENTATION=+